MKQVAHQLVAGPLVSFAVGVGDGAVGQAHFGDRHDNVRSIYRLGVLAVGAIGLATGTWTDASIGAMCGAAALVGSRVVPAVRGGGWQQFGMVSHPLGYDGGRGGPAPADPEPEYGGVEPPGVGSPGQSLQNFDKQYLHLKGQSPF